MTSLVTDSDTARSAWFKKRKKRSRERVGRELEFTDLDHVVRTGSEENRKRRTLKIRRREGQSWGFTLQSYGLQSGGSGALETLTYVDYVEYGGPADTAGMQTGDVLLSISGQAVEGLPHSQLVARIQEQPLSMRVVVLFEDCVRKVELHLRLRKLKNLLTAKEFELRSLELREKRIMQGITSLSDIRWSLRSSTSSSGFSLSPVPADTQSLRVQPSPHTTTRPGILRQSTLERARSAMNFGDVTMDRGDVTALSDKVTGLERPGAGSRGELYVLEDGEGWSSPNIVYNPRVEQKYTSLPASAHRKMRLSAPVGNSLFYSTPRDEPRDSTAEARDPETASLRSDCLYEGELGIYQSWDPPSSIYSTWSAGQRAAGGRRRGQARSVGNSLFYVDSEGCGESEVDPAGPGEDPQAVNYESMGARPKCKRAVSERNLCHNTAPSPAFVLVTPRRPASLQFIRTDEELSPYASALRYSGIPESPVFTDSPTSGVCNVPSPLAQEPDSGGGKVVCEPPRANRFRLHKTKSSGSLAAHSSASHESFPARSSPLLAMKQLFRRSPSLPSLQLKSRWSPLEFTRNKLRASLSKLRLPRRKCATYKLTDSALSLAPDTEDFRDLPTGSEDFRNLPNSSDDYRDLPSGSEDYRDFPNGSGDFRHLPRSSSATSLGFAPRESDIQEVEIYATLPKRRPVNVLRKCSVVEEDAAVSTPDPSPIDAVPLSPCPHTDDSSECGAIVDSSDKNTNNNVDIPTPVDTMVIVTNYSDQVDTDGIEIQRSSQEFMSEDSSPAEPADTMPYVSLTYHSELPIEPEQTLPQPPHNLTPTRTPQTAPSPSDAEANNSPDTAIENQTYNATENETYKQMNNDIGDNNKSHSQKSDSQSERLQLQSKYVNEHAKEVDTSITKMVDDYKDVNDDVVELQIDVKESGDDFEARNECTEGNNAELNVAVIELNHDVTTEADDVTGANVINDVTCADDCEVDAGSAESEAESSDDSFLERIIQSQASVSDPEPPSDPKASVSMCEKHSPVPPEESKISPVELTVSSSVPEQTTTDAMSESSQSIVFSDEGSTKEVTKISEDHNLLVRTSSKKEDTHIVDSAEAQLDSSVTNIISNSCESRSIEESPQSKITEIVAKSRDIVKSVSSSSKVPLDHTNTTLYNRSKSKDMSATSKLKSRHRINSDSSQSPQVKPALLSTRLAAKIVAKGDVTASAPWRRKQETIQNGGRTATVSETPCNGNSDLNGNKHSYILKTELYLSEKAQNKEGPSNKANRPTVTIEECNELNTASESGIDFKDDKSECLPTARTSRAVTRRAAPAITKQGADSQSKQPANLPGTDSQNKKPATLSVSSRLSSAYGAGIISRSRSPEIPRMGHVAVDHVRSWSAVAPRNVSSVSNVSIVSNGSLSDAPKDTEGAGNMSRINGDHVSPPTQPRANHVTAKLKSLQVNRDRNVAADNGQSAVENVLSSVNKLQKDRPKLEFKSKERDTHSLIEQSKKLRTTVFSSLNSNPSNPSPGVGKDDKESANTVPPPASVMDKIVTKPIIQAATVRSRQRMGSKTSETTSPAYTTTTPPTDARSPLIAKRTGWPTDSSVQKPNFSKHGQSQSSDPVKSPVVTPKLHYHNTQKEITLSKPNQLSKIGPSSDYKTDTKIYSKIEGTDSKTNLHMNGEISQISHTTAVDTNISKRSHTTTVDANKGTTSQVNIDNSKIIKTVPFSKIDPGDTVYRAKPIFIMHSANISNGIGTFNRDANHVPLVSANSNGNVRMQGMTRAVDSTEVVAPARGPGAVGGSLEASRRTIFNAIQLCMQRDAAHTTYPPSVKAAPPTQPHTHPHSHNPAQLPPRRTELVCETDF